jgi:CRISPR/Cas system CMR subunit Cmr4 (Cas7 group RAMP superfamily)
MSDWTHSRTIVARIVVTGALVLESPVHLGNGDRGTQVDLPLLRDAREGRPLLQGTSLAGALRNYVRAYERGLTTPEESRPTRGTTSHTRHAAELLFGAVKGDPEGDQSPLIVDDALAAITPSDIRDGVRIDAATRTALPNFKYDVELLPPGTTFPLRFELLLPDDPAVADRLRGALALALGALERGEIALGARKTRGYGRCRVAQWNVSTYHVRDSRADLLAWLAAEHPQWGYVLAHSSSGTAAEILAPPLDLPDRRRIFAIVADFALASPLLIRSEEPLGEGDNQPDVAHLRDGLGQPVLSGTSVAGALRARAMRVLNATRPGRAQDFVDQLFGRDMQRGGAPSASRLLVNEARIEGGAALVQNRVSIDRFTGGAFETALFGEAPHVGGAVRLGFTIHEAQPAEKGLLLLLLRDLWTGDLPLGGTASIGRGRLRGLRATIRDEGTEWELSEHDGRLTLPEDARTQLEHYVAALHTIEEAEHAA